jgi:hypothetical protein
VPGPDLPPESVGVHSGKNRHTDSTAEGILIKSVILEQIPALEEKLS